MSYALECSCVNVSICVFLFSSRRRHTRCALVTGVQTCALPISINDDGLQVTAPNWVTLGQIDAAVVEKASWIIDKLRALRARQKHLATADTLWQQGGAIPYLGRRIVLDRKRTRLNSSH